MITSFVMVDEDNNTYTFNQVNPIGLEFTKETMADGFFHITIHNLLTEDYPTPILENFYNQIRGKTLTRVSVVINESITMSYEGLFKVSLYSVRVHEVPNYRPDWNPFGDEYITIDDETFLSANPPQSTIIITPNGDTIESDTDPILEND